MILLCTFRYFDLHPETKFGAPGRFQGLNVGVLLLRLDRLRKNKMFNQLLSSKGMANLVGTYGFYNTFLGELQQIQGGPEKTHPLSTLIYYAKGAHFF